MLKRDAVERESSLFHQQAGGPGGPGQQRSRSGVRCHAVMRHEVATVADWLRSPGEVSTGRPVPGDRSRGGGWLQLPRDAKPSEIGIGGDEIETRQSTITSYPKRLLQRI